MLPAAVSRELEAALRSLRYGSIQIVVHDAKIVRIERLERIRLTDPSEASTAARGQPTPPTEACQDAPQEE